MDDVAPVDCAPETREAVPLAFTEAAEIPGAVASHQTGQLVTWEAIKTYIFAGRAVFTLVSLKTGVRITYQVRAKKADRDSDDPTFFVTWLRGPDNNNDYAYMGVLRKDVAFRLTPASRAGRDALCVRTFVLFLDCLKNARANVLGSRLTVWHDGYCGRCRRLLTVPKSVADGYGPECAGKVGR